MQNWKGISWPALRQNKLVRNTLSMLTGGAITMALQAVYFVMIARSLGPGQYGAFVGVTALMAALTPYAVQGVGAVLIKNVSRNRRCLAESLGNAILTVAGLSSALLALVSIASPIILSSKVPLRLVLLVGMSDLILGGLVSLAGYVFQAVEMLGKTARITAMQSGIRAAAAAVVFVWFPHPSALFWAVLYLGTACLGSAYGLMLVFRRLGYPRLAPTLLRPELIEGFKFSVGGSSAAVYNNLDKPLLGRLATLNAAGLYAIAYRVVDLAFQPVGALHASAFASFFQHGSRGIADSARRAKQLLLIGAGYGVVAGLALFFGAPVFSYIFGRQFAGSEDALRWLSPLVFLRASHYCYSNALTGADYQGLRSCIQIAIAVLNVALNVWLIPRYSWRGSAWASLVSDGLLVLSTWTATVILIGRLTPKGQTVALQPDGTS
jgi:O-antigen/teichoic acid export membrane protein